MYLRVPLRVYLLCFIFMIMVPCEANADTVFKIGSNTYQCNGSSISIDVAPHIINGRAMVPIRYLAESCGAAVDWNPLNQTVTLTKGQNTIQLTIGSKQELCNKEVVNMDVAPLIISGRTMLPARWVAEKLGLQVSWNDTSNTVTIFPQQASVQASMINVRNAPGMENETIGTLPQNTVVNILNASNGWYQIALAGDQKGWVVGWLTTADSGAAKVNLSEVSRGASRIETIINYAKSLIGVPYRYGGQSPKRFDCSGFVQYVFKNFGITLPRNADDQFHYGKVISRNEAKPGDIVAFGSKNAIFHSGIYLGGGKFISSTSHHGVEISSLSESYWLNNFLGFSRIIP